MFVHDSRPLATVYNTTWREADESVCVQSRMKKLHTEQEYTCYATILRVRVSVSLSNCVGAYIYLVASTSCVCERACVHTCSVCHVYVCVCHITGLSVYDCTCKLLLGFQPAIYIQLQCTHTHVILAWFIWHTIICTYKTIPSQRSIWMTA